MRTLLVVDDEAAVRQVVAMAMGRRAWRVVQADSLARALDVAARRRIDAALCDIVMPGGGGMELLQAFGAQPAAIPVVLMTGHPLACKAASPASSAPVLEKPFTLKQLVAALDGIAPKDGGTPRQPIGRGKRRSSGRARRQRSGRAAPVMCKVIWGS